MESHEVARGYYNEYGDITLEAPRYEEEFVRRIKAIPSRYRFYNPDNKQWVVIKAYAKRAEQILKDVFPGAIVGKGKAPKNAPLVMGKVRESEALALCTGPVLSRDGNTCRYCGSPAAQVDQFSPGIPAMDNLVACCLSCLLAGRWRHFSTIEEKAQWIKENEKIESS